MKRLAQALDRVRATRSRIGKEEALAALLAEVGASSDDAGLAVAARVAAGVNLPTRDSRSLGVGWALILDVAAAETGLDARAIVECTRACGDLGEAFGLLVRRIEGQAARPGLTLAEVGQLFDALAASSARGTKRRLLDEAFARAGAIETKYLAKAVLGGLRVGAQGGVLEGAVARAFGEDMDAVRRAAAVATDPGVVAVLAKDHRLGEAHFEIGRPAAFMLATPIETLPSGGAGVIDPALHVIEDKIDGVRAQLHKRGNDVAIFARGLDRVAHAFPEIVDAFHFARGDVALDGEIVVLGEGGRPRPFQTLQPRLRKSTPSAEMLAESPAAFVAYDILADGMSDGNLLAAPWSERRARLEAFARERGPKAAFVLNPVRPAAGEGAWSERLDAEFEAARARGYEGLVLKRTDAPYDAGRRGQASIKVKRAFATLDVVVTAAEEGHGRRAGVLSDYTFAVWRGEDLVNVGKAYSGLTDEEIDALTRRFERITVERYGSVRAVRPEVVLEVAFDGVQPSTRHKSGYALRFPRIVRIREDKTPEQADKIGAVESLFRSQLESGHREQPKETPKTRAKGAGARKLKKNDAQLDLFAAPKPPGTREPG